MLVNLTPHPIRVYARDVPDRIIASDYEPVWTIDPSGTVARIGEIDLGTQYLRNCEVPVEYIEYRHDRSADRLPDPAADLREREVHRSPERAHRDPTPLLRLRRLKSPRSSKEER